jgi:glycosyltransferase involved in cell wall biosynthesis
MFGWPRPETLVGGADLVHALDLVPPPSRLPVVLTVHDLTAVEHPEFHPPRRTRQQRAQLKAAHRAAVVLTNSQATADRLCAHGIDADRVHVTRFGVTAFPEPAAVDVPRPYLLAVGEITRRKGYDVLLRALAAADGDRVSLVFAGPDGFDAEFCRPLARHLGLADRTVFLGAVDDAQLATLYRDALALCFPSYAEGFGLPVLEAMAHGTPVVASDLDAVREIAGDAACLVAPGDVAGWVEALSAVVGHAALRAKLAEAGPRRAAPFTWDATAAATIDAYERALAVVA